MDKKVETVGITYRYGDLPPRTVWIPKDKDTPEERARRIKEDIAQALAFKPSEIPV